MKEASIQKNKECPFCGGNKLKFESKNTSKGIRLEQRSMGYKSKFTGSIRCNRCFGRGPTCYMLSKHEILMSDEKEQLEQLAYAAWNNREQFMGDR